MKTIIYCPLCDKADLAKEATVACAKGDKDGIGRCRDGLGSKSQVSNQTCPQCLHILALEEEKDRNAKRRTV